MSHSINRRALAVITAILLTVSCGSNDGDGPSGPTGPTGPPPPSGVANISGSWNGTSDFERSNNERLITTISITVNQNDRNVEGTVRFTGAGFETWRGTFTGTLSGPVDTEFLGTVSLQSEPSTGSGVCTGQMTMNGRVTSTTMRWDAASLTMTPSVPSQAPACLGRVTNIAWIAAR